MTLTIGLSAIIGVLLGLMGGGGSILTVPLLVYVADLGGHEAIKASLIVVGASSIAALLPHALAGQVRWRVGATFSAVGVAGAYLGGRVAHFVPETLLMVGFGLMMVFTGIALFRCRRCDGQVSERSVSGGSPGSPSLLMKGFGVGVLTGLVGVGGGFLIVPALTLFAGLSTRNAVATSLLVISLNSLAGFAAHTSTQLPPAGFIVPLIIACATGGLIGSVFAERIPQRIVRRAFAVTVIAVAIFGFLGKPVVSGVKQGGASMFGFFNRGSVSAEAHKLVDEASALVDVRSPGEFSEGHIPGAVNIPVDEVERRAGEIGADSRPVVVYCRSGARSARAAATLQRLGFKQVVNLGPKAAW